MNTAKRLLLLAFVLSSLGCAVRVKDEDQARGYRIALAAHLGLAQEQVHIEPGYGVTYVTIIGVPGKEDRQRIAIDLATLNKNNAKINPLKWTFL